MTADDHTSDMEVTLRIIEDALGSSEANHVRTTFDGVGERIPDEEIRAIWREGAERARKAWRDFVFLSCPLPPPDRRGRRNSRSHPGA